jgi:hypothetical protein
LALYRTGGAAVRTLKKWPLLFRHYDTISGKPHQGRVKMLSSGISTDAVAANCRGITEDHIKEFCKSWPSAVPEEVVQAMKFEQSKKGK